MARVRERHFLAWMLLLGRKVQCRFGVRFFGVAFFVAFFFAAGTLSGLGAGSSLGTNPPRSFVFSTVSCDGISAMSAPDSNCPHTEVITFRRSCSASSGERELSHSRALICSTTARDPRTALLFSIACSALSQV